MTLFFQNTYSTVIIEQSDTMKRRLVVAHLISNGCILLREGGKHTIFYNPNTKRTSSVPRHSEINDFLAKKICKDLGIEEPNI